MYTANIICTPRKVRLEATAKFYIILAHLDFIENTCREKSRMQLSNKWYSSADFWRAKGNSIYKAEEHLGAKGRRKHKYRLMQKEEENDTSSSVRNENPEYLWDWKN